MTEQAQKETRGFQTEVSQLLDLMVHSLYSKKEIFLRELISNGSDAADKLRFEALADDALYEGDGDLAIDVSVDADARTLTVRDNGIGMSHDEVIENLGTIARSGTRQFFDSLTGDAAKDAQLIGQFGVGFYSCFMVADRVTVTTRKAGAPGEEGVRWESAGDGEFTVEALDVPARGTEVTLQLREGEDEFLDAFRLRHVVRTYSDHIMIPVRMPKPAAEDEDEDGNEAADAEAPEVVNSATALWTRSKSELSEDEYNEFYKHVAHDFEDPLAFTHNRVEGNLEYTTLLYVPARAPFDLWDRSVRRGVKLYVRRVFIMDDAEQLLPAYLRFVRGVIDCADLPLNVSREILQNNRQIDSIRAGSVKRVLDLLGSLAKNEPEKYATFWSHFGRVIKEGMIEDAKNRDAIAKLLRFATTHGEGDAPVTSLDDYVGRMKEGQEKIYFITADSHATAIGSPHLEVFRARGIEVALLTDEVDEWVVNHLTEYEGKPLQSVAKGELDLGDDDPDEADGDTADHGPLVERLKTLLGERVKDVRTTDRLTTSPSCLIAEEHELGAHMERILKAAGQDVPVSKRVMEVNPDHAIAVRLAAERDDDRAADIAHVLYDQAVLGEGGRLDDAAGFVSRVNRLIVTPAKAAARKKRAARPRKKAARPKKAADAD